MHINKEEQKVLYYLIDLIKNSHPVDRKGNEVRWSNKIVTSTIKEYARDYLHPACNKRKFVEKAQSILLYDGEWKEYENL